MAADSKSELRQSEIVAVRRTLAGSVEDSTTRSDAVQARARSSTVFLTDAERIVLVSCLGQTSSSASLTDGQRRVANATIGRVVNSKAAVLIALLAVTMAVR